MRFLNTIDDSKFIDWLSNCSSRISLLREVCLVGWVLIRTYDS